MGEWGEGESGRGEKSSLFPRTSSLEPLPTSVFLTSVTSVAELPEFRYILRKRIRCRTSLIAKQLFADLDLDQRQL